MFDLSATLYLWIKAIHIIAVISWMAGMFYLPRLFVYHVERGGVGTDLDLTFCVMEGKLLKVIMTPAMIVSWIAGLILIADGALDLGRIWGWLKLGGVCAMTVAHFWLAARRRDFARGENVRSGRTYRLANEVPTVLMILIVVAIIVRPG